MPTAGLLGILTPMRPFVFACLMTSLPAGNQLLAAEQSATGFAPGIELPAGAGRELVLAACTRCHDLKGVPAFKGYWTRQQWLAMIETMVKHGAPLNAAQAGEVADYLALHFGRQPAPARSERSAGAAP
jgi:mono/diheme cytochrome c family protein